MAEVAEGASFTDPATAISQGRRHLLVRDYTSAVSALSQACDLLARKHGDTSDELGEPYLLYGRALLGLAREEAGVLGGGLPGSSEDREGREEEDEEEEDEEEDDEDEEEEEEEEGGENENEEDTVGEDEKQKQQKRKEASPKPSTGEDGKQERGTGPGVEGESEEKSGKAGKRESAVKNDDSNKTDDSKIAEQKTRTSEVTEATQATQATEATVANGETASASVPTSSSSPPPSSTTTTSRPTTSRNGDVKGNGGEGAEDDDVGKDDEEDEVNNLQVAWEVLELAKLVLLKRGPPGWKLLAESYRLLGEVAMEGGNHQGALSDLQGCLNLLEKIEPREPRAIAEIHYQLGLAHSLANDFDASIEQFNQATSLLEARIKELEETKEPPKSDDPFYTVDGEIQELKDLLPEIQEKITDMRDFKHEACKLVIEGIKNRVANGDGAAGPSGRAGQGGQSGPSDSSSKVQKPASDISHLVRKKRKADESEPSSDVSSPLKKPTPEKAV